MIGHMVVVITLIVLLMIPVNQGGIGHLNAYMERSGCKHKRVKEPKLLSTYIEHEDTNSLSIKVSLGLSSDVRYDGTVYKSILIIVIINLVLCLLLVAAVLIAGLVFDYLMWWAVIIAICYTASILGASAYYHNKFEKQRKSRNYKK